MTKEEKRHKREELIAGMKEAGVQRYGVDFASIYSHYQRIRQHLKNDFKKITFNIKFNDKKYNCKFVSVRDNQTYSFSGWLHRVQKLHYLLLQFVVFGNPVDSELLSYIGAVSDMFKDNDNLFKKHHIDILDLQVTFSWFVGELVRLKHITDKY